MVKIVGIQFKDNSKTYYFDSVNFNFKENDQVIVDTARGLEIGTVTLKTTLMPKENIEYELKPVIRAATEKDLRYAKENEKMAIKSFEFFKQKVKEYKLNMKPLYAEYTIDRSKIIFYYESEDRVDFRDLLKALTPEYKMRVELRQIGPREAARVIGGIGICGRELCCKTHLQNFNFVTMKMAKEQGLSLNNTKISGCCGKLMCCIAYESEIYKELKKEIPGVGTMVKTPSCASCKIVGVDYLKKLIKTQEAEGALPVVHPVQEIKVLTPELNFAEEVEETVILTEDLTIENVIEEEVITNVDGEVSEKVNDKRNSKKRKYEKRINKQRERNHK